MKIIFESDVRYTDRFKKLEVIMTEAILNDVGIEGVVTVVPENIRYFSDDAERLGIDETQAKRITESVGVSARHVVPDDVTALDMGEVACRDLLEGLKQDRENIGF